MNLRTVLRALWLITAFLTGCAGVGEPAREITAHRWRLVDTPATKPWLGELSQAYTYVLIGDGVRGTANDGVRKARVVLGKVLNEIAEYSAMPQAGQAPVPLNKLNQFLVPALHGDVGAPSLQIYDFDLSHDYLAWFESALQSAPAVQSKLQGSGPFLITLKKPLPHLMSYDGAMWKVTSVEPMLVFDLTGLAADIVPMYMKEYKRVVAGGVSGTSAPESWRAQLAQTLITWGDALPRAMAATVQAGEILQGKNPEKKP